MTPVETLRAAATRVRENANVATPGPWTNGMGAHGDPANGPDHVWVRGAEQAPVAELDLFMTAAMDARLIALVASPPVALAIADLLDREADVWQEATDILPAELVATVLAKPSCVTFAVLADLILASDP